MIHKKMCSTSTAPIPINDQRKANIEKKVGGWKRLECFQSEFCSAQASNHIHKSSAKSMHSWSCRYRKSRSQGSSEDFAAPLLLLPNTSRLT